MKPRLLLFSLFSTLPLAATDIQWNTAGPDNLWNLSNLNWTGGTAFVTGDNVTFDDATGETVTVDAGGVSAGTINVGANNGTWGFTGGTISGALSKSGTGALTLSSTNSFSSISINGGPNSASSAAILLANSGALGTGAITLGNTGTMTAFYFQSGFGSATVSNNITFASGAVQTNLLETGNTSQVVTLGGVLSGGNSGATIFLNNDTTAGVGRYKVTNASNTVAGLWKLNRGGLEITSDAALGNTANGIQLDIANSAAGTGLIFGAGSITINSSRAINISDNSVIDTGSFTGSTIQGVVTFATGKNLYKRGTGELTLNGANTGAGATQILEGSINMGSSTALGGTTGTVTVSSGAMLNLNGQTVGAKPVTLNGTGISSGGALINSSATAASLSGAVTLGSASSVGGTGNVTLSGAVGGAFALTKVGSGQLTLSGSNTYTGGTIVNAGTLVLARSAGFGGTSGSISSSGALTINSGAIATNSIAFSISGDTSASNSRIVNISGGTLNLGFGEYIKTFNLTGGILNAPTVAGEYLRASSAGLFINSLASATTSTVNNKADLTFASGSIDTADGAAATDLNIAGVISENTGAGTGAKTLTKTGAGNLQLSGANTFTGGVIVDGGTLTLANAAAFNGGTAPGAGTGNITINSGATVKNIAGGHSIWGGQTNTRTVFLNNGTIDITAGQEYFYKMEMTGGTVTRGASSFLFRVGSASGAGAITTFANATTATISTAMDMTLGNLSLTVADGAAANDLTISGAISENTGAGSGAKSITKSGTGSLLLSGANTYTGVTNVNAGTVKVGNITAFGAVNTAVTKVVVASGAAVDFNGQIDATYGYTISGTGIGATGALTNSGATIGTGTKQATNIKLAANASIGGTGDWALLASGYAATSLDLNAQTLTKVGSNTVSLVNTTTTAGMIQVSGGTLALGVSGTVNGSASAFTLDNTAGANLSIGLSSSVGSLAGGGTTGGNTNIGSGATLTVGALNTNTTYSGVISGAGLLTKSGTGILTLSAANTFTGNVLVSNGELQTSTTNNVRALGADTIGRTVTVSSGATLKFLGSDTFGNAGSTPNPSLIISGTVTNVAGKLNTLGNVTLTGGQLTNLGGVGGAYQAYSLAGSVTVNGSLASSITTTGTTFTGVHLGTNTSFSVADATGSTATDLTISAPLINRNGDLGGNGGLTKSGAGTVELTAANTYTGGTTINAGTLALSGSGSLSDLTAVVVNSPGAFDISGISSSEKIASLSGSAGSTLKLGAKSLELGDANDTSFAGSIDSSTGGELKKVGTGVFTLAASGYTGTGPNINISMGTLLTGTANLPGSSAFTLSGGALNSGTFSNSVGSLSVTSGSVIDFAGGGTPVLTFASQGTWTGLLQIWNWSGSAWSSGTGGKLKLTDGGDGTLIDPSKIQFYSGPGTGAIGSGGVFIGTELVPVPEPTTLVSSLALLGFLGFQRRRKTRAE